MRVVYRAYGEKNNNNNNKKKKKKMNNFRVDFPVNLAPELKHRSSWSGRNWLEEVFSEFSFNTEKDLRNVNLNIK